MEVQIKKTVKSGNSSAVILPRAWLEKEVRIELIEKTQEMMLLDIIKIAGKHIELKDIIGIYLTGSYARKEEEKGSDIDILILTKGIDKKEIREGAYSLTILSIELLKQKLEKDLFPIGQMIKEAKPLLNSDYLTSIEVKVTNKNISWYLTTTKEKLEIIKRIIEKTKKSNRKFVSDKVAYTLILRIRTLHIIRKLTEGKIYSKQEFIRLIERISNSKDAYSCYLNVKNDLKETKIKIEEIEKLYNYLAVELSKVIILLD